MPGPSASQQTILTTGSLSQTGRFQSWEAGSDGYWHSRILGVSLRPRPRYLAMRDGDGEEIGLPVVNAARARAAERALADAREAARHEQEMARREQAARMVAEDELRRLRARMATDDTLNDLEK